MREPWLFGRALVPVELLKLSVGVRRSEVPWTQNGGMASPDRHGETENRVTERQTGPKS